jgi:hypothetical protein
MFRRRPPPRRQSIPTTRTGAKIERPEALQNPPNDWQQWLRTGTLVVAKSNLFATDRQVEGINTTFADNYRPAVDAVLLKGEHGICLGELVRTKRPDPYDRKKQVVHSTWYFLFPSGMFVADPSVFGESESDPEE